MVTTPEIKPRVTVSADSDYNFAPRRGAKSGTNPDRIDNSANSAIGYAIFFLALLVVGYFVYAYYGPSSTLPNIITQSTVPAAPPMPPPVTAPVTPVVPPATPTAP